jgi:hypothetical protein
MNFGTSYQKLIPLTSQEDNSQAQEACDYGKSYQKLNRSASFKQESEERQTKAPHRLERIDSILARSIKMSRTWDISKQGPEDSAETEGRGTR